MNALPTVQNAISIYPVCSLRNIDSDMLLEELEFDHREALAALADFVLEDLPYNIRPVQDEKSSNHDIHASTDTKSHVKALQ